MGGLIARSLQVHQAVLGRSCCRRMVVMVVTGVVVVGREVGAIGLAPTSRLLPVVGIGVRVDVQRVKADGSSGREGEVHLGVGVTVLIGFHQR